MNRFCLFCVMLVFSGTLLFAADWSGVLDSTVNYTAGAGDAPDNSFGIEQYANLRLRVRAREIATFHAAFNLIALSGNFALPAVYSGLALEGPNYAAAMELERLYVRMSGEHLDSELGLLRMNFGYSQVWASSDFINPVNPLAYNARPRGVLGLNASIYPTDTTRLMGFVAAPRNPLETEGAGFLPGLVMDQHWS
ncbi:MAG: hypothetical protein FWH19_06345, partial [Treponema sp.]|nr:hypothetical protein [Treponema sp.]